MLKQVELYFYLRVTEQHSQLQTTGFTIYKCVYLQYKMYKLYSVAWLGKTLLGRARKKKRKKQ